MWLVVIGWCLVIVMLVMIFFISLSGSRCLRMVCCIGWMLFFCVISFRSVMCSMCCVNVVLNCMIGLLVVCIFMCVVMLCRW